MDNKEIEQKLLKPANGIGVLLITLLLSIGSTACVILALIAYEAKQLTDGTTAVLVTAGILIFIATFFIYPGLRTVRPNEALVLTLFGRYYGTILQPGFYFVNPFSVANCPQYERAMGKQSVNAKPTTGGKEEEPTIAMNFRKTISLKSTTLNNGIQKVNDVLGNPIIIGAVVIYKVVNPTKAVFNVDDYNAFLSIQTDSTIRNIARLYPYDIINEEEDENEKTLRGSSQEIAANMKAELEKRVEFAGLEIEEIRITHLSYAEEIAAAMLQRQQATAIIAARQKIVDGAVSMVKMAIEKLGDEEIVVLDEERKAAMVSNLLVVLCSGKDTQPIVNSGSIY